MLVIYVSVLYVFECISVIYTLLYYCLVARSKTWVCGRSFAGIAGSKPAGVIDICLL